MLGNKKTQQRLDALEERMSQVTEQLTDITDSLKGFKEQMHDVQKQLSAEQKQMEELAGYKSRLVDLEQEFEKELNQFKLLKTQMNKQVMEKVDSEVREVMHKHFSRLKTDADSFNKLRKDIENTAAEVSDTKQELTKFKSIAQHLKEEDFTLAKYARRLEEMDKEKLRLMRKIDSLERMVSKQRNRKQ